MTALLKECWPPPFSGLAVMLYMRIDQVMLAEMVGEREVGLYSAALRLSEVWYALNIIVGSTMPYLTEMRARSEELYYQRLQQLFTHLVRIACIVGILLTFGSSPLIYFLYGESYSQAAAILTVHIWAGMFVFLGVAAAPWAVNEGATKFALYQTSLGAITNIALNLYLIPLYGAVGCALATTISYAISAWISNSFFPETRKLFKKQSEAIFNAFNIFKGRLSEALN
jgi:PST family polysaccharide transporter